MDEPIVENGIVIAHAGQGTDNIGRFDIVVDTDDNCIDSFTWLLEPINHTTSENDDQLEAMIAKYKDITDRKYQRIVTRFHKTLTHPERNRETNLGSLFADIFKQSLGVDVMFLGSGSIRGEKLGPIVEYGNLAQIFPYNDEIFMVKVTGSQLRRMIKHYLRDEADLGTTEYYQLSEGVRVVYNKSEREILEFEIEDLPVREEDFYTVGLQNFHFLNIGDFLNVTLEEVSQIQKPRILSTSSLDIVEEYLSTHHKLNYKPQKRVHIV
jgi:5'-nucleotidase